MPAFEIPENSQKSSSPASERLREYLQGLEKKLDAFSSLIVSESASDPLTSTRKPLPSEIPDTPQNFPSYRSERWRDYFGADFKYIPAKTELNQRLSQDYRYTSGLNIYLVIPFQSHLDLCARFRALLLESKFESQIV